MLSYRAFRNSDPPVVAALWRKCAGHTGLVQPVSVEILEQLVFGKLYFDRHGLILAFDDNRPVGFAYAAFGPDRAGNRLCTEAGVTCLVVVRPDCSAAGVASGLLGRAEAYLRGRGAKVLYGGGIAPGSPFYLGLYGGTSPPGVLNSDRFTQQLYRSHGYEEKDRTLILQRELVDYQPAMDRRQRLLRRAAVVQMDMDPPARNWWEACAAADFDHVRFRLIPRDGKTRWALATFRSTELYSSHLERMLGLVDVEVVPEHRRQGAATFLLGESFRQLARQGTQVVEVQTSQKNAGYIGLCQKLGLREVHQAVVFRKHAG